MYSQTGWADQAEIFRIDKGVDLRTVQKILNTYFYCHLENIQSNWLYRAETLRIVKGVDLRAEYKISSRFDTYDRFYRLIEAEIGNKNTYYVFLLPFLAFIGL